MKDRFISILNSTNIVGMDNLLEMMEEWGFYTSPCSTKYHLCCDGGLLEHSLNVYDVLVKLNEGLSAGLDETDMAVCSLLHDLGKMGDYKKPNYIPNMLKTGRSEAQPFKNNPELIYEEHEVRSVEIASRYIALTEEQAHAIRHHNGLYGKLDSTYGYHTYDEHKLSYLLHVADMYCSRFIEEKESKNV